jgi:hypothetical protein
MSILSKDKSAELIRLYDLSYEYIDKKYVWNKIINIALKKFGKNK